MNTAVLKALAFRGTLALVLAGIYVVALRPARAYVTGSLIIPGLQMLDTQASADLTISNETSPVLIDILDAREGRNRVEFYKAPLGRFFLIPAMLLLMLFPSRGTLPGLFGFHLAAWMVSICLLFISVGWMPDLLILNKMLVNYLVPAFSMGLIAWMFMQRKNDGKGFLGVQEGHNIKSNKL